MVFDVLAHLAQNPRRLVTKDELLQAVWPTRDPASDVLQATCAALGVGEALACELMRHDHGFVLTSWRGATMGSAAQATAVAGDLVQLATRRAGLVTGRQLPPDALPADPFWRGQLAQAIDLYEAGNSRQALDLLNLCAPHHKPDAHLLLLKARLLYRSAKPEATRAQLPDARRHGA